MDAVTTRSCWDQSVLELFVDLYRTHECLYDCNHIDYKNKETRRLALENISLILGKSVADIKRKIDVVRTQFARERLKQQTRGGRCTTPLDDTDTDVYVSKWFLMPRLGFLDPHVNPRNRFICVDRTARNLKRELSSSEDVETNDGIHWIVDVGTPSDPPDNDQMPSDKLQATSAMPDDQSPSASLVSISTEQMKRRHRTKEPACQCRQQEDQCDLFGRFVARELQAIDEDVVRTVIKKQIMNLIFDAQL